MQSDDGNGKQLRQKLLGNHEELNDQEKKLIKGDDVLEKIAARKVFPLMVPEGYKGRNAQAPIKGAPGLSLSITESPPGDGA